jgi:hypothetical protein
LFCPAESCFLPHYFFSFVVLLFLTPSFRFLLLLFSFFFSFNPVSSFFARRCFYFRFVFVSFFFVFMLLSFVFSFYFIFSAVLLVFV